MRRVAWSIPVLFVLLVADFASSPKLGVATISGTVKDEKGNPVRGALVSLVNTDRHITVSVMTQREGRFSVDSLSPGAYEVRAQSTGFELSRKAGIHLERSISIDLVLKPQQSRTARISSREALARFPEGPDKALMTDACWRCHGLAFLLEQKKDRGAWERTIKRMLPRRYNLATLWDSKLGGWDSGPSLGSAEIERLRKSNNLDELVTRLVNYFSKDIIPDTASGSIGDQPDPPDGGTVRITEFTIPYPGRPEKPVASSNTAPIFPYQINVAPEGTVWFSMYQSNRIGRLDPHLGEFRSYKVPTPGSQPHGVQVVGDGLVWFAEQTGNNVGRLNPRTGEIVEIPADGGGHTMTPDSQDNLWMTVPPVNKIRRLNTRTKQITDYPLRTPNAAPYGIVVDRKGQVWWCQFYADSIATLDPRTGKITEYPTPTRLSGPRRMDIDGHGNIWFAEWLAGKVGKVDPTSGRITEYDLPSPSFEPYEVRVDAEGGVWAAGFLSNTLARLDPTTGTFVEYPLPTARGEIRRMAPDPNGGMWFAESHTDTIGHIMVKH